MYNKDGSLKYGTWQVRLPTKGSPSKTFKDLERAVTWLATQLKTCPPRRERKFVHSEMTNKRYKMCIVGLFLRHEIRNGRNVPEIRFSLTFKSHHLTVYLGTINTITDKTFSEVFVKLYLIRRWLEKCTRLGDYTWCNKDNKMLSTNIYDNIPQSFIIKTKPKALMALNVNIFRDYVNKTKEQYNLE